MREFTGPGAATIAPDTNLTETLWERERVQPHRAALAHRVGGQFVDVSVRQFAERVRRLAAGLIGLGIEPGQRVAVMSRTRIEWTLLDYAIWSAGAVTVPIYETSAADQMEWILADSEAVAAIFENVELRSRYDEAASRLPACKHAFVIDDGGLDELSAHGAEVDDEQVLGRARTVTAEDLATIVYTSGTTGRPKGCVLTHGNLVWDLTQVGVGAPELFRDGRSTLLFLPLAHIFGRIIQCVCVAERVKIGYATDPTKLTEELPLFQPTFLLSVPRVFEKIYNGAQAKAYADGKGRIFDVASRVAIDHSRGTQVGRVPFKTRALHTVFDKLVYSKLRSAVGGRVEYSVSGGAALGERLGHFFNGAGITVLEGYGLTETSAGATLNTPSHLRIGTVGRPLPGCTVRIADDGEILIKGGNVFSGYWNDDEATREAIDDDGFLHSGDLGQLDADGFLRITGRKKEIIVTAGGKNVAPALLEDRIRAHRLVSQAMVVGDGRPFIAALITLDPEEVGRWAEQHSKPGRTPAEVVDDADLRAEVQTAVDQANHAVSRAESIRAFRILPDDFTIEGGELTPTLKVRREVVTERHAAAIEELYSATR
ncbi:MAG: AMP-dependent synthetase/ligase [Actinomycetota bacterium]|nr:AMP-dependent synthetase/ligase [Actinomycetota bacterium]